MAFKSAIQDKGPAGQCYLIQTKDITIDGKIDVSKLARVNPESPPERHILETGDILLRLRGPIFSATIFESAWRLPTITTNQTAVIRCDSAKISPYYLEWYLNSSAGQRYFNEVGEGTNINKITAKTVAEMQLLLPTHEQQEQIASIYRNWCAQKDAYKRLIENGDLFFNQLCEKIQIGSTKLNERQN